MVMKSATMPLELHVASNNDLTGNQHTVSSFLNSAGLSIITNFMKSPLESDLWLLGKIWEKKLGVSWPEAVIPLSEYFSLPLFLHGMKF